MRLPVIGSSINREASFVKPSNFGRLSQFKTGKIKNTIYSLGHKIVSEKLRKTTIKYLSDRQSQVVSISDAPIEWMVFDDIPFVLLMIFAEYQRVQYQVLIVNIIVI